MMLIEIFVVNGLRYRLYTANKIIELQKVVHDLKIMKSLLRNHLYRRSETIIVLFQMNLYQ